MRYNKDNSDFYFNGLFKVRNFKKAYKKIFIWFKID